METALRAVEITKRFGPTLALQEVDFVAEPGEIHALVGENGAGKSTLMNLIAGRIRPDRGEVTLAGQTLRPGSAKAALTAGIALVGARLGRRPPRPRKWLPLWIFNCLSTVP
jgi:ribose transport system ATP-binding protein